MNEIINYVGRTYTKYTAEFTQAVRDLELVDPTPPPNPDPTNPIAFEMWKLEVKDYRTKEQEYSNFRAGLYNVVFGQCTEALQDKLKSHTDFLNAYQNGIALLTIIKTLTYTKYTAEFRSWSKPSETWSWLIRLPHRILIPPIPLLSRCGNLR